MYKTAKRHVATSQSKILLLVLGFFVKKRQYKTALTGIQNTKKSFFFLDGIQKRSLFFVFRQQKNGTQILTQIFV